MLSNTRAILPYKGGEAEVGYIIIIVVPVGIIVKRSFYAA